VIDAVTQSPRSRGPRYTQTRTSDVGIGALDELLRGLEPEAFAAGTVLIRQGEPSPFALYVTEGSVGVFSESSYERVLLAELEAPRLIGELGVLAGIPRTATIEAVTAVKAVKIQTAQLRDVVVHEPEFLL
jgi:CRP-like cAMP-binding protein